MIKAIFSPSERSECYVLCLAGFMSEHTFMERAGARPDSYAGRLARRLYEDIFLASIDLKRDYQKFYNLEYPSFGVYLRKLRFLHKDDADEVEMEYERSELIIYYRRPHPFLQEGKGEHLFGRIFEPTEEL